MPEKRTIYHKEDGPVEMWAIDANNALRSHSKEWSPNPWPKKEAKEPEKGKEPAKS